MQKILATRAGGPAVGGRFSQSHDAEKFAFAVYDAPDALHNLLEIITDTWLKVTDAQFEILPSEQGGYWNGNQPLWTPGRNMFVPADAVSILSPDTVEEFVTPRLRRVTEHLDACIAHTHSTYLHAIDSILQVEGFQCIQAGQDTDGPPIDEVMPVMRRIQESKSLIVAICQPEVDDALEQARKAWNELDPAGLSILVYLETAEKGKEFIEKL